MPVIDVALLRMQPTTAATAAGAFALHASGRPAGAEPRLTDLRAQEIVWVELRTCLHERWRRDHPATLGAGGVVRVVVNLVVVAHGAGEHHHMPRFHRELAHGHHSPSSLSRVFSRGALAACPSA